MLAEILSHWQAYATTVTVVGTAMAAILAALTKDVR